MIIKNFDKLAVTKERKLALEMIEAGLDAIDTKKAIQNSIKLEGGKLVVGNEKFPRGEIENIFVIGVGKCSLVAGEAIEEALGDEISAGIVVDVKEGKLNKIHAISGDHPFPTEKNVSATQEIINLLGKTKERDIVIFVISGGGSTLLCQPEEMTCLDEKEILKTLYDEGADIRKINTVRKHISMARGGYLAKHAYPARVVSLIFSDVPGDDLEFIASGPTIKDTTTMEDAEKIVREFKLKEKAGIKKIKLIETPKDDKYFENVKNTLVVSNKIALAAMKEKAKSGGFDAEIISTTLEGESRDVAREIVDKLHSAKGKTIHLYGGETTVTVRHPGKGGRNLELALSALTSTKDDELVLSFASDGVDNTDFAGGIADAKTKESAQKLEISAEDSLERNSSYDFFEKTEDYIKTGHTGRNVADLVIALKK